MSNLVDMQVELGEGGLLLHLHHGALSFFQSLDLGSFPLVIFLVRQLYFVVSHEFFLGVALLEI